MTSAYSKIVSKSKALKFEASRNYRSNADSSMPYEELIVVNEKYPDTYFLVHKNMLFHRSSISDTSYDVYSFDKEGNYIKRESVEELGLDFFRNMKQIKKV